MWLGAAFVVGLLVWYFVAYGAEAATLPYRPHLPDLSLLAAAPLPIRIHVAGAASALAIGTALLIGVKGTMMHRTLGWGWVVAMGTTAVSSFFIHRINPDGFSFIHLISGWTVIALPMAVYAARKHRVKAHRRGMVGLFVGGLLVAGVLSFLPGRLMWQVVFG
jgi:uncharacterized membrane protein